MEYREPQNFVVPATALDYRLLIMFLSPSNVTFKVGAIKILKSSVNCEIEDVKYHKGPDEGSSHEGENGK